MKKICTMNHAQRAAFARSLYIRRARLPRWAVLRVIVEGGRNEKR